ncbi:MULTISPECIES: AsmA-like C-terminal region-containing protein [unclassified Lentimonas]|uniref:AsmA-like C-terminal region-containing protein n=1 Tax=unclassified Lentimonas TaxID=2630993 RepID=UPI00132C41B4|nr:MULTISPECIES: AsmA-like C-terminal region-containing protein [unclassified Lentimonas]CAA6690125.1 Unannotated [Lentimonas sp. CC19]CAA6690913.1 Unannotated [Lentimonas sp. CC10]CAA7070735.1 Unannotated [Lentimonas sp. CC11]
MWKKLRARGLLLLELCLDLFLLILFSAQAFLAGCLIIYGYIPVPPEWANERLFETKIDGYYIQAESYRLKLNGEIEVTHLKIYHGDMDRPIFEADSTVLEYTLRKDGTYQFTPTDLVVSNATLFMPAIYSLDGTHSPILEYITFHLTPAKELIRIDSFAAQHEDIHLRGSIDWPILPTTESAEMPPIERFYKLIATTLKEKKRFSPFIEPTLEFALTARQDDSVDVSLNLSCEQLAHTYATGTDFTLKSDFKIHHGALIPQSALLLKAQAIEIPAIKLTAEAISAYVAIDEWPSLLHGIWPEFKISAYQLTTHQIKLRSPKATISPADFPELDFYGSANGLNGGAAISGRLNCITRSGYVNAHGSVRISTLLPESAIEKLPKLELASMPYYDLSIHLNEGFKLDRTTFRVDVNDVTANGLTFDHILANGSYHNGLFRLDEVLIDRGKQWIDATFSFDSPSQDFRITLRGSALPDQYGPLLPEWWDGIFEDIDFNSDTLGYGDFVIYGNAAPSQPVFFLGHAKATNVAYKKALIAEGELIVRGFDNYTELYNIDAKTSGGWAKGSVGFTTGDIPGEGLLSVRYDFDSLMPLDVASKVFGGDVASIISDFEVTKLPRVILDGASFNEAYTQYANDDFFNLEAEIRTPLAYKKTPLDHLKFKLYSRDEDIYLRDLKFGYADGNGSAIIDIYSTDDASNQLRFQASLAGANQDKAIQNLPSFDDIEDHLTKTQTEKYEEARSTGTLSLNLHAQGPANDIYQFTGFGDFKVFNEQLGAIQLLGPLSTLLKNTRLNFTSFNLDQMRANFEVAQQQLNIQELIIDGPRTRIWANGTFQIPDQALDMDLRVNLFANIGDPDSTINSLRKFITSPLPNLLVFDLTGTVQEQKIRLRYDPRKFIPILKGH